MENFEDEFEFKPLTQGLGFHKKNYDLKPNLKGQNSKPATKAPRMDSLENSVSSVNKLISAIPAYDDGYKPSQPQTSKPITSVNAEAPAAESLIPRYQPPTPRFKTEVAKQTHFIEETKPNRISAEPLPPALQAISFSIPAFIFDMLVTLGLVFLFTGIVLAVTDSNLELVLANAQSDWATKLSLAVLVFTVIQLYAVLSRSFFGRTIGEWAFDIQLGTKEQHRSAWYPIQVGWRALLVSLTGFVILPTLSLLLGKDVTYYLTGVRLFRVQ